ncbi:unnamed protein product [Thelazia callipaeda]|uniref:Ubiq_cyt_C_chap domain-containing protein n=1 Tax=Thelazia callipaeda TaxID=103827 RepID=A0A0N5CKM7_THECL|nr:unnamed protein product [Thelazia callipaeda]
MIRKTNLLRKCISSVAVCSQSYIPAAIALCATQNLWYSTKVFVRRCSSKPIFEVKKNIVWNDPLEQSSHNIRSKPSSSIPTKEKDEELEDFVDLENSEPKTLAEANIRKHLLIKKLDEMLQHFDEQNQHENLFKKLCDKWNLRKELWKAKSMKPDEQVTYTKEMLTSLDSSAAHLYFDCANRFPYLKLCSALCLPDYFSTWYKLTLMHIWMLLVRLQSVLEAGAYARIRNSILEIMFDDIDKRLRVLSEELQEIVHHQKDKRRMAGLYIQTFFEYDEGFLSDDPALAGALWRNLYMQRPVDPVHLNRAVFYIRGTMAYLDSLSLEQILLQGIKDWKTARSDGKFRDENVFELARSIAPSLLEKKYNRV